MQWVLAASVWLLLVGGTGAYLSVRGAPPSVEQRQLSQAVEVVTVRATATADLGSSSDPFALDPQAKVAAVIIKVGAEDGPHTEQATEHLSAGQSQQVFSQDGLIEGRNVLTISIAPPATATAIRFEAAVAGHPLIDTVVWCPAHEAVVHDLVLDLSNRQQPDERAHD